MILFWWLWHYFATSMILLRYYCGWYYYDFCMLSCLQILRFCWFMVSCLLQFHEILLIPMLYGIDGWIIDVELLEKVSNGSYQDAMLLALNAWHHESAWKTVLCNFRTGSSYIQWVEAMRNGLSIAHPSGMPHDSLFKINRKSSETKLCFSRHFRFSDCL